MSVKKLTVHFLAISTQRMKVVKELAWAAFESVHAWTLRAILYVVHTSKTIASRLHSLIAFSLIICLRSDHK